MDLLIFESTLNFGLFSCHFQIDALALSKELIAMTEDKILNLKHYFKDTKIMFSLVLIKVSFCNSIFKKPMVLGLIVM